MAQALCLAKQVLESTCINAFLFIVWLFQQFSNNIRFFLGFSGLLKQLQTGVL